MNSRRLAPLALAAFLLLAAGCSETTTPTEPAVVTATPRPFTAATLSGIVVDENGAPRPSLAVACQNHTAVTGAGGAYGFIGLVPRATALSVSQPGAAGPELFDVVLAPGENTKNVTVPRFHGQPASMAGIVMQGGRPLPGAHVYVQEKSTVAGPDGAYMLGGLESGNWGVSVSWNVYEDYGYGLTLNPGVNSIDIRVP